MRALALAGPRATEQQVNTFQYAQAEMKVLSSATADAVSREIASLRPDIVLIFGGDGTVNVHLNQLAQTEIPILVVPSGSGNDLARTAGIDSIDTARRAWLTFLNGERNIQPTDLGVVSADGLPAPRYFSCCANLGLDADAARRTDAMPDWAKSHGGYFAGGLLALANYEPQMMTVLSEDRNHVEPAWFVSISNTPTFGGGLKIAPHASVTDGQLDITFVSRAMFSRAELALHFPKILSGKHVNIRGLSLFSTASLRVETEKPSPVYADGEHIAETPCNIDVAPAALQLVMATYGNI